MGMDISQRDQSQFLESFSRLAGNWPGTPQETIESKAREFLRAFEEYGPDRFDRGVTALIDRNPYQFFPTLSEFRGYVPSREVAPYCDHCQQGWVKVPDWDARRLYGNSDAMAVVRCACRGMDNVAKRDAEYQELYRQRAANPAAFFGTADVVCMMRLFQMRAAKGRPAPTEDEVFATIAKVRERAGI